MMIIVFTILALILALAIWGMIANEITFKQSMKRIDDQYEQNMIHIRNGDYDKIDHSDAETYNEHFRRIYFFGMFSPKK